MPCLRFRSCFGLIAGCALTGAALGAAPLPIPPVTPDAMPEAVALLTLLQAVSGHYTLTGQHNYPATRDTNSRFAAHYTGKMPAVWTSDLGFAAAGDTDSYLARPDIVQEAIRQHRRGAIVSLCWHAVPPTADEPVTFRPLPGADPAHWRSIQGRLPDDQFREILTPGTALYAHWAAQVDAIAVFLRQLQDAHVPVLWRPYHEMNGDWFWWGGRTAGPYTSAALYRQIFDRLVNHHHLKNLIWVWSVDRVGKPAMAHAKYFPGIDRVDVLALDVYGRDFAQSYYDSLVLLARGKPLALAEVGSPPTPAILAQQPRWTYYATWAGMVRNTTKQEYAALFADPRVLGLNDPAYAAATLAYRKACGLPPVHLAPPRPDFSGTWVLDETRSNFGPVGASAAPARLVVARAGDTLNVRTTRILEYAPDEVAEQILPLDGTPSRSLFMKLPRTTTARLSADGTAIRFESVTEDPAGPPGFKRTAEDTWTLQELGNRMSVHTVSVSSGSPAKVEQTLVYARR